MGYGFKIVAEGDYACFTRPEFKVERVSYDVPTPGALEGMLKNLYWKPSVRYVIDQIIVFNPFNSINIKRNEVKNKILQSALKRQMEGKGGDPRIYAASENERSQRSSSMLKNVKYGIAFHFELTGLCDEESKSQEESEKKHYNIIKRRLEKGQYYRMPYFGCSELAVNKIELVDAFDESLISSEIKNMGDVDLGFMSYRVNFEDQGIPVNNDWENPVFSDKASTAFYHPHMVNGIIDVEKYRDTTYSDHILHKCADV